VAKRIFLMAVATILMLSAFGLWVTETRGDETDLASFYLLAVMIALAAVIAGGVSFMFTRRDRYADRRRD
jgi:hypothetical protein